MNAKRMVLFLASHFTIGVLCASDGTWTAPDGGDWSAVGNWQDGTPAAGTGATAFFTAGAGAVTNDMTDLTLLGLQISGTGFTFAGNTLTLDSAGFISVLSGSHATALPLVLSGDIRLEVASGQTLTINGALSGPGGITMYGGRVVLGNAANAYTGATIHKTGILEVASVDALGESSTVPSNLVLGEGTFRYTGPSAIMTRGYTLLPGIATNRAAVLDVVNADTTLTVAGKVEAPGGSFIKTGEGTVAYTYPGYQEFNKSKLANRETGIYTYDVNGVASTNDYAAFTVEKGRMIIGAPGQTNVIYSSSGWIGCKTLASPRMDIIGGVTRFLSAWLTIGRGTGTTASPQSPSLHIRDSVVFFEGSGLCMDNPNGQANHRCRPVLSVSNSFVQATQNFLLGEDSYVTGRVDVGNCSSMICNQQTDHRYGMQVAQAAGAAVDMTVTFDGASTNSTYLLRVNQGGKLTYKGNSVLALDHTQTNAFMSSSTLLPGLVRFDGATLKQRTPQRIADWLINHTNLLVGANGLIIQTDSRVWLDNALLPDPAGPGGMVTKIGAGTLALGSPLRVPLTVSEGTLALSANYAYTNVPAMPSYTFASGTTAEVSGVNALLGYTLDSGSGFPILDLRPNTFTHATERWTFNSSAMRRRDGLILLTRDLSGEIGSVFLNRKRGLTSSWTAEFTWRLYSTSSNPADGFALVLQNDARGVSVKGSSGSNLGYAGTGAAGITNSVALGFDVYRKYLRLGTNGVWAGTAISAIPDIRFAPAHIIVAYDGAGTLTVRMKACGTEDTYTVPVDLAAVLGTTDAYVGLTASTGSDSQPGMHTFSAFTFDAGTPARTAMRLGGSTALASGETLTAVLNTTARQNGYILGTLSHAADSVLDVSAPVEDMPPPLTARSLWKINGTAYWKENGAVATSTNVASKGPGSVFTINRYPVTGSWTARFHFDIGLASPVPADYFCFVLQNESDRYSSLNSAPASGLAVQWRYYDGTIHSTRLKVSTNGITTVMTDDIAPVTLTNCVPADFIVDYDDTAHAITVTAVQSGVGTNTTIIPNIDLPSIMKNANGAHIGFLGVTGGSYAENIISDFSFVRTGAIGSSAPPYLAFDAITGSGPIIKRGRAALGLIGDIDHATSNLSVRLEEGGLVLRKTPLEPIDQNAGARSDWVFSAQGSWSDDNSLMPCPGLNNAFGTATTARRVRIADAWTATFTFLFGSSRPTSWPADAFCLFFNNDSRSPGYASGNVSNAGFTGMRNSFGLRWYFYPGNTTSASNAMTIGRNGAWDEGANQSYLPVVLKDGSADFIIRYDPAASKVTSIITQGALCVTNTFTGVDLSSTVGSDYAYVGFGGGTGGAYWDMLVRDFKLTCDIAPSDTLASQSYLANLVLPDATTNTVTLDSSITDGMYTITAANVGAGATLDVAAASQAGTLSVGSVSQSGDAVYSPASTCTLTLNNVVGGGTVTKTGSGTLALAGSVSTYTGGTVLSAGTLSLSAALLPTTTDLSVTGGSTLNLAFSGKQYIHALAVDGVQMPGGVYTAAKVSWITGPGRLVVMYPPVGTLLFLH